MVNAHGMGTTVRILNIRTPRKVYVSSKHLVMCSRDADEKTGISKGFIVCQ